MTRTIILESEAWTPGGLLIKLESSIDVDDLIDHASHTRRAAVITEIRGSRNREITSRGFDIAALRFDEKWRLALYRMPNGVFRRVVPLEWEEVESLT